MQSEYSDYQGDPTNPPAGPPGQPEPGDEGGLPRRQMVPVSMPAVRPLATYTLLGIIIAVYLAGLVLPFSPRVIDGFLVSSTEDWLFIQGAKINDFIIGRGEVYRLLTAMFLHGGLTHLFFNAYALYLIGRNLERVFGHARYLLIYFLGGLTGSLFSLLFSPYASVGASGAIFAIFGAEIVFIYRNRRVFGRAAYRQLQSMAMVLALNVLIGLTPGSRIDNWGHMGGFVAGLALAWFMGPRLRVVVAQDAVVLSGGDVPALEMVDDNTPRQWLAVPILYAALYVLVLGAFLQMQGM
ncbi:MAG: hypothetical protein Kow0077_17730 [Anaerolineae bacterium]